jgi:hypothetical protein
MRYFFTSDASPRTRPIAELQRRACWIALALLLLTLNDLDHSIYLSLLGPAGSVILALLPPALVVGGLVAVWMAIRPASSRKKVFETLHTTRLWQRLVLLASLIMIVPGLVILAWTVALNFIPVQFTNDGTSLDTNAAILVLQGQNPYTDSTIPDLMRRFDTNVQANWTTPLRVGQFAGRLDYPSSADIQSVLSTSLKANDVPEFEAKVSYPALSFLSLLPIVMTGNNNVFPFFLICYIALVALAWRAIRAELRPWLIVLSLANLPMLGSVMGGNLDVFCTLLVALAWWQRDHRWGNTIFFGLALATKQTAWFLAPFFLIMLWRNYGLKEALYRSVGAAALMLLINLPFIIWNPHAWLAGVMTPMADPMFPLGVGLINLSTKHLIPYLPQMVYTALEGVAILAALVVYWFVCRKRPEAALLLATIPLFFAWRSLPSYFACIAFPVYVLTAARARSFSYSALALSGMRRIGELVGHRRTPALARARVS